MHQVNKIWPQTIITDLLIIFRADRTACTVCYSTNTIAGTAAIAGEGLGLGGGQAIAANHLVGI